MAILDFNKQDIVLFKIHWAYKKEETELKRFVVNVQRGDIKALSTRRRNGDETDFEPKSI